MDSELKVTIIVPAYNEEESIEAVLDRLISVCQNIAKYEIIVVDDGSVDSTAKKVRCFDAVRLIRHNKNQGKGAAIRTGLKNSNGDIFIIQDSDMEYFPEDIIHVLKPILAGNADVVFGSRFRGTRNGMSFSHYLGNKLLSLATSILFVTPVSDVMTGYKAFRKEVIRPDQLSESAFNIEIEITSKSLKNGFRFIEVPVSYAYRQTGVSKISNRDGLKALVKLVHCRLSD